MLPDREPASQAPTSVCRDEVRRLAEAGAQLVEVLPREEFDVAVVHPLAGGVEVFVGSHCITSGTQPVAGGLQSWCKLKRGVLVVVALGAIAYRSQWGSLTVPPCARAAATAAAMSSTRPLRAPWPAVGERWSCRCSGARRARQVAAVPWTNGNNELRDQKTIPLRDGRAPNDRDRTGQPGDCRSVRDREPANAGTSRGGCRTAVLRTAPNRLICARCSGGGRPQRHANIRRSEQTRGATTSKSDYCL